MILWLKSYVYNFWTWQLTIVQSVNDGWFTDTLVGSSKETKVENHLLYTFKLYHRASIGLIYRLSYNRLSMNKYEGWDQSMQQHELAVLGSSWIQLTPEGSQTRHLRLMGILRRIRCFPQAHSLLRQHVSSPRICGATKKENWQFKSKVECTLQNWYFIEPTQK